jgi:hypothetical protein
MELIYNTMWIFKNVLVSIIIILIIHFFLEYLKENYNIDLFENIFNKRKVTFMNSIDNVQTLDNSQIVDHSRTVDNTQNMDYELSKLINEKNTDKHLIDTNENILDNNSFTNIDNLTPII